MPSALRDLFGFRLALRCNTPQASDTILGQGWATAGADAADPRRAARRRAAARRGGPAGADEGVHLADEDVHAIAERAIARRTDAWHAASGEQLGGEAA